MAASAPPLADTRKPPSQPPAGQQAAVDKATAQSGGPSQAKPAAPPAQAAASQQRFDRMAVRAKLAVSQPGDAAEREAEQVAEQVTNGSGAIPHVSTPSASLSRAPEPAPKTNQETPVMRSTATGSDSPGIQVNSTLARRIEATRGRGKPMEPAVLADMADSLGEDFTQVRIHTDAEAMDLCSTIQARAFTFGEDVYFAQGEYAPLSKAGRQLLAHELTHVIQQAESAPILQRKPKGAKQKTAKKKDTDPLSIADLPIPSFKFASKKYQGAKLRRSKSYNREGDNKTYQAQTWDKSIDSSKIAKILRDEVKMNQPDHTYRVASNPRSLGNNPTGDADTIAQGLLRPWWGKNLKNQAIKHEVDHIIELQLSGWPEERTADQMTNYELVDRTSNGKSGNEIKKAIRDAVRLALPGENPEGVLKKRDVIFTSVKDSGTLKNASRWTQDDIVKGMHIETILSSQAKPSPVEFWDLDNHAAHGKFSALPPNLNKENYIGSSNKLVVYYGNTGGKPQSIDFSGKKGNSPELTGEEAQRSIFMRGFEVQKLVFNRGRGSANRASPVGNIRGQVFRQQQKGGRVYSQLPAIDWPIRSMASTDFAGYLDARALNKQIKFHLDFMSPMQFNDIEVDEQEGLVARAKIQPSLPLFQGADIDIVFAGDEIRLEKYFTNSELSLPPPIRIDSSSLLVSLGTSSGLRLGGEILFGIEGLGDGSLAAMLGTTGGTPSIELKGEFDFASELFDTAQVKAWWRRDEGFGASGVLAITEAGKVKGIKSAHLDALYEKGVFSATGNAETDIPGLKGFKAEAKFVDEDNFSVTGSGDFEKLPGIESGALTLTLERIGGDWALAGKGHAVPALPGGAKGNIDASYDKGVVLLRGNVHFNYGGGLLDGDVTVAVTNAAGVAPDGSPSGEAGPGYQVFGEGTLTAALIKDRLDGTLRLRLLPDGSVRVGGAITARDFEVFPKYPKDGGEFFNKDFSTPPVPLPGLGFSVGSVSVGITFSATLTLKAHAAIGPGRLTGISLGVEEFDPANVDFNTLKFTGGGTFVVYADAGFSASAALNLIFGAAIAELVGSVGAEAAAGIPADQPVLSAHADFTFSRNDGLDLEGTMNLNIAPELKFRLFGSVSARLNLLIDTITVWKKDWTLAEANYKLPVGINATGTLGYNSKTGRIRPENPADAIRIDRPRLDGDAMQGVLMGHSAPPQVDNRPTGRGSTPEQPVLHRKPAATGGDGMRRLPTRAFASGAPIAFADA